MRHFVVGPLAEAMFDDRNRWDWLSILHRGAEAYAQRCLYERCQEWRRNVVGVKDTSDTRGRDVAQFVDTDLNVRDRRAIRQGDARTQEVGLQPVALNHYRRSDVAAAHDRSRMHARNGAGKLRFARRG